MLFLIRLSVFTFFISFITPQLSFGQRAASAIDPNYNYYLDSTKKILPASEDELVVNVRTIPKDTFNKYKNDSDFNYEGGPVEADDWITRIKNWIREQMIIFNSSKTYSTLIDILYYGLMVIAILLIIRGLIKADRRGLLFGKVNPNEIKFSEKEEDIIKIDFDELITEALNNKQYKLAIRYFYLKSLKMLSEKSLIELKNNKTNYQYLTEIINIQIANAFKITTNRFEWIWYGDFPVDENIIKNSQTDFNNLFVLLRS